MIVKMFCIYDSKAEAYMQPFFFQATGLAIRAFEDLVRDDKSNISKYPQDFTLFELGTFDDQTAKLDLYVTPMSLGVALQYKKQD